MNEWLDPVVRNYINYFGVATHPVVWEVGSRDGHDGVELAERIYGGDEKWFWDRARVTAVEPNPDQVKVIKDNYPEVFVVDLAASNETNRADFVVYEGDEGAVGSSSLDLDWKGDYLPHHIIEVGTVRLERLINDEEIDIMKIDVEGYSMQVLEGLGDKLKQIKVLHVETEKWTGSDVRVKAYLMPRGFMLVDEREQWGGMPDQVWVRH